MNKSIKKVFINGIQIIGIFLGISILLFVIFFGIQDKVDPLWSEIGNTLIEKHQTLDEKTVELDSIFYSIQKDKTYKEKEIHAIDILDNPFLPTIEYNKFLAFLNNFSKNKRVILSGVSGSGNSTLSDRVANLFAVEKDRILYLRCVEQMSVEYNKLYIGYYEDKKFIKGKLLELFDKCYKDTLHNYVFIIDDIDKIYPSTLFGSALWSEMDNPEYENPIDGYTDDIKIPSNLFLLSITHKGVGSTVELNAEHFRRLTNDNPYFIGSDYVELFLGFREDTIKKIKKSSDLNDKNKKEIIEKFKNSILDKAYKDSIQKVLYFFAKANQIIEEKYAPSYVLGQWSALKKIKKPVQLEKAMNIFIEHVNAFSPKEQFTSKDFKPVFYTIKNNGLMEHSNMIYSLYLFLLDIGVLNDVGMTIMLAIISAIIGIYAFRKKKIFIKNILNSAIQPVNKYKDKEISFDEAKGTLLLVHENIEKYIIAKKLNFSEANFLLLTIGEQLKYLENKNQLETASVDLKKMFDEFMEDGKLNEKEHKMLIHFLDGKRSTVSLETYENLRKQIDETYMMSLAKIKMDKKNT